MSLIIGLGSNLENREANLNKAVKLLDKHFNKIALSSIFESEAIEYLEQPDFLNCVAEYEVPDLSGEEILQQLLNIEISLGRERTIDKGPRTIDLDILFIGTQNIDSDKLKVPHQDWMNRSFVVLPLKEIPFYKTLEKRFTIPTQFSNTASLYKKHS